MMEDRLLVWRARRGNKDAMRRIYEAHKDDLLTLARVLLDDLAAAEDVVHDVFVSFAGGLGTFTLTGSLKGYLAVCVQNKARDHWRRRQRRTGPPDRQRPAPTGEPSPEQSLMRHDLLEVVRRALGRLPYDQREAVVLHLHSGLTFKRIAELQNVPVPTAQGRYRYGLEKLRSLVNGEWKP
ncbi:MAG: sigma-70 family RNA polymerase sigma factor [Sedimentisphaerales bacterium]|nr:sigma-70 family RNA polymerase sigma factor [Sedimentisphaerales bacterium]